MLLHLGNTTYLLDVIPTETPTHSTLFKDLVGKQPPTTKSVYTTKSTMVCSSTPPETTPTRYSCQSGAAPVGHQSQHQL